MRPAGGVRVEPLSPHHDRARFACGEDALERYIRTQAVQDMRRNVTRVFVAVGDDPGRILGYYTLSAAMVEASRLPAEMARRLPKYPVPAALIGRLAVERDFQRRGLGGVLLADAIKRVFAASKSIAIHLVVVDAKNDGARGFYEHFAFRPLTGDGRRLFLPLGRAGAET